MFAPVRLFFALRPHAAPALIAAAAMVAALFAATPFLIPAVADRYGIALGTSALISAVQVAGFAATTFVAGRRAAPSRRKLVIAAMASTAANALSVVSSVFLLLLTLRLLAGVAAGLLVWLAWADAMKEVGAMRDVAAAGPLSIFIAAPLFGWLPSLGGDQAVYGALSVISLSVAFFSVEFEGGRAVRRRMSPSKSNVVLLVGLGLLTTFGSSVFVFVAAIGESRVGLSSFVVSVAYSANAAAGFVGTRHPSRPGTAWLFVGLMAGSVGLVVFVSSVWALYLGMIVWGFSFWSCVPDILRQVADWSLVPEERVGDAQAVMALGRAIGPALGAALVGAGTFGDLGVTAVAGLLVVAGVFAGVWQHRRGRQSPTHAFAS